jgi:hypothetical protein
MSSGFVINGTNAPLPPPRASSSQVANRILGGRLGGDDGDVGV